MRTFMVMGGAIALAVGIVLSVLVWTEKKKIDTGRRTASTAVFKRTRQIADEISGRVTPIVRASGLCAQPCPSAETSDSPRRWSLHAEAGSLLVLLLPNLHGKGDYSLYVYAVTPQQDGSLRDEILSQALGSLLREFDFPNADTPYRELQEQTGSETRKSIGPRKFEVLWPPFPHQREMVTQWQWSLVAGPRAP